MALIRQLQAIEICCSCGWKPWVLAKSSGYVATRCKNPNCEIAYSLDPLGNFSVIGIPKNGSPGFVIGFYGGLSEPSE